MGRGDFEGTCSKLSINVGIPHNRNLPSGQGKDHLGLSKILVPVVMGVDGNPGITEHGLRPGGCNDQSVLSVLKGITNVVQKAVLLFIFDLEIGKGSLAPGAPVGDVLALLDETFLVQPYKDLAHGL